MSASQPTRALPPLSPHSASGPARPRLWARRRRMPDDQGEHLHQLEHFQDALAALVAAVHWTPVPLTDDAGQDPARPYATHEGVLELPGLGRVPCYLLNTGEPVFDLEVLEQLIGRDATEEER